MFEHSRVCFLILYEAFTELSNYTCQRYSKCNAFHHIFSRPNTQSMLPEWQCCKKMQKKEKWEWLNWNRCVVEGRWIPVLSVESCHNSPQQLFWEQLGVARNVSHTHLHSSVQAQAGILPNCVTFPSHCGENRPTERERRSRGAGAQGGRSFNLVSEESFKPRSWQGGRAQHEEP